MKSYLYLNYACFLLQLNRIATFYYLQYHYYWIFIIYSLGLQWAWQFNILFLPINIGFDSYCDHYIISSINKKSLFDLIIIKSKHNLSINSFSIIEYLIKAIFTLYELYIKKLQYNYLIFNLIFTSLYNLIMINRLIYNIKTSRLVIYSYLFDISQYILLPIYSFIRLFV